MPITYGALSCRCFRVEGKPPAHWRDAYAKEIARHAYRPPQVDRGEFHSFGWVNPRRILETRFDLDEIVIDGRLTLVARFDTIALNSRLFKARVVEEAGRRREQKKRDRLSREERSAIEEKVQLEMAKRQTPATAFQEMTWNLKTGDVIYTAASEKASLTFQEMFTETFGLPIEPLLPYIRAERIANPLGLKGELIACAPSVFSIHGATAGRETPDIVEVEGDRV